MASVRDLACNLIPKLRYSQYARACSQIDLLISIEAEALLWHIVDWLSQGNEIKSPYCFFLSYNSIIFL